MKQDTVLLKVKLVQRNKKISNAKQQNCEQVTFPSSCAVILRSIDVPLDLSTNSACHFICSNLSGNDLEILGINNIGEFFANNSNCIGLLREGDNNSKSRWIEDDKKLRDAGLLDNEMVELRKRKISLKINFSDNHFVEDKVNVAQNVEEYLSKICLEKGIGNFDEYGFCILPKVFFPYMIVHATSE
ncbi:hypothetical protein GJ496_010856 [Pomphorhynchus laevis]|nr:hypothetical protein GJ496_010856 [Pomphorhynchus laevis]